MSTFIDTLNTISQKLNVKTKTEGSKYFYYIDENKQYNYNTTEGNLLYLMYDCNNYLCRNVIKDYIRSVHSNIKGLIKIQQIKDIIPTLSDGDAKSVIDAIIMIGEYILKLDKEKEQSEKASEGYYEKYMKYKAKYLQLKKI